MNIWNNIKRAWSAYWSSVTTPLYRAQQSRDGWWRIIDCDGDTVEAPFPNEAAAKDRIAALMQEHWA
jgi:hypothetical protein